MDLSSFSPILTDLKLLSPDGFEFDQLYCSAPGQWKRVTDRVVKWLIVLHPSWSVVEFIRVGGSCYGNEVIVTSPDPISPNGAIYLYGADVAGPQGVEAWPEGMLRLGFTAKQWVDRVLDYGDDFCVCPGSIDEDLGERAEEYRQLLRELNPGMNW